MTAPRQVDRPTEPAGPLRQVVAEDFATHRRRVLDPGFHAIAVHRLGVWRKRQPAPVRKLVGLLYKLLNEGLVRNVYGVTLYDTSSIGRRVRIGHHVGVLVGSRTVIGDDCVLRQNVTLGLADDSAPVEQQPRIGSGVHLGAGCSVLGPVTVGDGAVVGPHAVVLTDLAPGATAFVPPARVMKRA